MSDIAQLYNEAEKLKDAGNFEGAIAKLNELLQADDTYVLAHLTLAVAHGKLGQHEDAIQHAHRACELEPDDAFNFTAMSVTYQRAFSGTGNPDYKQMAEDAMARAHMMQGHQH